MYVGNWNKMNQNKMTDKNINEEAIMEVNWLLQESYKLAVKLRGITDWSAFGTGTDRIDAERDVEKYQLEIAKLISNSLIEKQRAVENEKFEKRMDASDARFEKRMTDKDEEIGFRKGDNNVDDRDTSDIGKP